MPLDDDCPVVRVFEDHAADGDHRPLVRSSSFDGGTTLRSRAVPSKAPALRMRHRVAAILDGGEESDDEVFDNRQRPQSFHPGAASTAARVQVRNVAFDIDEHYFK